MVSLRIYSCDLDDILLIYFLTGHYPLNNESSITISKTDASTPSPDGNNRYDGHLPRRLPTEYDLYSRIRFLLGQQPLQRS